MSDLEEIQHESAVGITRSPAVRPGRMFRRPSRWAAHVAVLVMVLAALLITTVILVRADRTEADIADQRQAALDTAQRVATDLSTIGAQNAQERLAGLSSGATGAFREQLTGYSAILRKILETGNVASDGRVTAAGIERIDARDATVLVCVATTVKNTQLPGGQPRFYRLAIALERNGARWLASNVEYVS